jgi:glycine dehydrogenase subunit 2
VQNLLVPEALMIKPTETESIETLDHFIGAMLQIAGEAKNDPDFVKSAPHTTAFKRFDEAGANRNLNLRWLPEHAQEPVAAD